MVFACRLFLLLSTMIGWHIADAAPYIPADGKTVLETLPSRNDPVQQAFARLRARLATNPQDLTVADKLAQMYIVTSRIDGDPRYLGYAEAVLRPWWTLPSPPEKALLQRAIIRQSTHQFRDALADLELLLKADPKNGQAWLTRATILTVLGQYAEARVSCERLEHLTYDLVVQTCANTIGSLNGNLLSSYQNLVDGLHRYPNLDPGLRTWVMTLVAEMAARSGDADAAEAHFHKAMTLDTPDGYLLGAYADFLLDQGRPGEVVGLLKGRTRNDALLLRYALALQAEKSPAAQKWIVNLSQRFAAAAMRGDTVHQREQARFELHLLGDPGKAVQTALRNWEVQKEPADLRILLESAMAAQDKQAMALAVQWIDKTRFEDERLSKLLQAARGKA